MNWFKKLFHTLKQMLKSKGGLKTMNTNDLHNNCKGCVYEDNERVCGGDDRMCNLETRFEGRRCNIDKLLTNIDRFGTKCSCVYGCNFCIKNKKSKEPVSRYDWAYS